ncbi:hypothetical protein TNCT_72591 [Trichonephila clavata]|uniref:Uncharacterized protein n=1 Tax=Trichonephila clavata TaxID=2740835 RepID=A0A8X6H621_TRICU|nr:hypothetical protein TNCT_72591 [Trichonephila clavata]
MNCLKTRFTSQFRHLTQLASEGVGDEKQYQEEMKKKPFYFMQEQRTIHVGPCYFKENIYTLLHFLNDIGK